VSDEITKAFDFAADLCKQLITLATGIIALTITFFKDVAPTGSENARSWLFWSWAIFLISVVAGILHLMALTGILDQTGAKKPEPITIRCGSATLFSRIQIVSFGLALILTTVFGFQARSAREQPQPEHIIVDKLPATK
jgi:hypothetical protein